MSGKGFIIQSGHALERQTNKPVISIIVAFNDPNGGIYIEPVTPFPQPGDWVEWTDGLFSTHVLWKGQKLKKVGYAFDPSKPLD